MTIARKLSNLFAEERRLEAQMVRLNGEIKALARDFWRERGYQVQPRREALEIAVREELAKIEPTPLEKFLDTGKAF